MTMETIFIAIFTGVTVGVIAMIGFFWVRRQGTYNQRWERFISFRARRDEEDVMDYIRARDRFVATGEE